MEKPSAARVSPVKKTIHKGRHLIFKLRKVNGQVNTKSYAVLPLPPKVACKGSSAGAESCLEVAKGVTQKLKPGKHIASADGSPALQKAAGLATLPKKGMTQDYVTLLRKLVQDGMAKENKTVSYGQPVTRWRKVWQMSRKDS
jgi:hypothetical protein